MVELRTLRWLDAERIYNLHLRQKWEWNMHLLLRRDQRRGLTGAVIFQLDVRANITDEEVRNIERYRLADTILYTKRVLIDRGAGLLGFISRIFFRAVNVTVSVNDLANGKRIKCKNIIEMLAVEDQVKEAAVTFKQVLNAATYFGGEEVIEI
jgi:hypothetical protein